jgi:hypothetical protein
MWPHAAFQPIIGALSGAVALAFVLALRSQVRVLVLASASARRNR